MKKINLIIYGATGSIGKSVLSIVRSNKEKFNIQGITCNKNYKKLLKIAKEFNVKKLGINKLIKNTNKDINKYSVFDNINSFSKIYDSKTDVIIFAISGLAGLDLFHKLCKSGKKIGMANKECIISLGENLSKQAKKSGCVIVPLDSEHNSIFHLLHNDHGSFDSITITATGGPFRKLPLKSFNNITIEQALSHPVWKMGKKISIDSATMVNKALEIIEAKYLFNLDDSQIDAVIHPQAIVHAMVNYKNGITTALLNKPDMRIPISSLFFKFNDYSNKSKQLKLLDYSKLEFLPINAKRYPAIILGREVMKIGGLAPNAFNYLNEILVRYFLKGAIKFVDITALNEINLEKIFAKNRNIVKPSLEDIKNINNWIDENIYLGRN
ncbi:1-deoxy-D-xylulose-5-phosphate reductoisomerase [Pelagibacteraceae bacterium]|nr:1-deoxy-D-xylulose-5-phosphate reductoisomerase [Pelagibacteraceae bacterium]